MISIVIPVYNQADKITATLNSIERQSFQDYEVIIVNDGSSDNVENVFVNFIISRKSQNRFLFLNQRNQGAPAARNKGLEASLGDYLFFCDADAVLAPEALEIFKQALDSSPESAYAYSSFYWGKKLFRVGEVDVKKLKHGPCIHTMSLVRRSDIPTGAWDESIKKLQDWDFWLSILEEKSKLGIFINKPLFTVSPGGSMSFWLPSFVYSLFPFLNKVKEYKQAVKRVKEKHGLAE